MEPGYLNLFQSGELDARIEALARILESCELCPRRCRANRLEGKQGYCRSGLELVVSAIHPHFGEEDPLSGPGRFEGTGGSGTIFLTGCNLGCVYCQNYDISHLGRGSMMSPRDLARGMIGLQDLGCHNINLVTPTHFAPRLVESLRYAIEDGLKIPLVYNCGGYENADTIRLLEGIVDIYMPDIKYSDGRTSELYSAAPDYFERCREAVIEMYRQVGELRLDAGGIAEKGLLVRHLVLPHDLAGSREVLRFISEEVSPDTYVNIMAQYHPAFRADNFPELSRRPTTEEYLRALATARELGLHRGFGGA